MTDTIACWVILDTLFLGKSTNSLILGQVGRRLVLYIVVDGEHQLLGILDTLGAQLLIFVQDCGSIVVGHDAVRRNLDIIAAAKDLSFW